MSQPEQHAIDEALAAEPEVTAKAETEKPGVVPDPTKARAGKSGKTGQKDAESGSDTTGLSASPARTKSAHAADDADAGSTMTEKTVPQVHRYQVIHKVANEGADHWHSTFASMQLPAEEAVDWIRTHVG